MNKNILVTFLLLGIPSIFFTAAGQTITQLSFSSALPSTFDMDYIDDHLIISQQFLKIYDVSNPEFPNFDGQVLYPGNYAYQVAAEGSRVYMAKGNNGVFAVYNISNFSQPWLTGSVNIPATSFSTAGDLIAHGNMVYMSGFDSLYVIEVSDSSLPHVINRQQIPEVGFEGAGAMGIIDDALFIITSVALQVYDITDPAIPQLITSYPNNKGGQNGLSTDTIAKRVFIPWANALATFTGYDAVDVSNPASPSFLFSDSTDFASGDYGETTYYNNVLFISQGGGVNAFDVSPLNHHYVTSFTGGSVPNAAVALDIRDSIFYNARGGGFEVLLYSGGFPTTASEIKITGSLLLFPNPIAADLKEISIYLDEPLLNAELTIINVRNEKVSHSAFPSLGKGYINIPLPGKLPAGMYVITIKGNNEIMNAKLLVE